MHRQDLGLYFHSKEFWGNGVRTHVNSKGKIPSTGKKILVRGGSNPRLCFKQDSEPNTQPTPLRDKVYGNLEELRRRRGGGGGG